MWPAPPLAADPDSATRATHATAHRARTMRRRSPRSSPPRHARQGAAAGAARALARRARRDRPLGAAQARHRRLAHRRLGAAGEDRRRRARRQGPARDRAALARPDAALHRVVRLARRPRRQAARARDPAPFRPAMLAHAIEEADFAALDPARFPGRMEMGRHPRAGGRPAAAEDGDWLPGSIRAPARISRTASPISIDALRLPGAIDGELLIVRDGRVQSLQRAAAAAQPQSRHAEADGGISRASARL